ncbi:MAG: 30S ribosomal protein S12 methylthiotransferase RimO [Acidobacteriota bacterium]
MARIGFVSLGCAKNLVDTEVMLGLLARHGHEITPDPRQAEIIVVNTCGFIDRAKEESVNTILEMAQHKLEGRCRRLIVAGCLVERYRDQIRAEIPEVDAVIGTNEVPAILDVCDPAGRPPRFENRELFLYSDTDPRLLTTPPYTAWVKIAEGCDHPCTFCVIPRMRGRFRSRPPDSILREARRLAEGGVKELNLVAQDSTMYGWDHGNRRGLAELLRALGKVDGLEWIRVLYAYPTSIDDAMLDAIAETEKVCKYIDMPLQSAAREVLRRMKRGGNRQSLTRLVERIRERIPGVTLRTTMIVGFPGETDEDFQETLQFVKEVQFDRLGVFTYSDEEDSEAWKLEGKLPARVKQARQRALMKVQAAISRSRNRRLVGCEVPVLLEGPSRQTEWLWEGRLPGQAPEIDGVVYLNDGVTEEVRPGEIRRVRITEAHDYDFVGTVLG